MAVISRLDQDVALALGGARRRGHRVRCRGRVYTAFVREEISEPFGLDGF